MGRSGIPIEIQGKTYKSLTDAANYFGVSVTAIHHAKKRGKLDSVGLGSAHFSYRPCEVNGKKYKSVQSAASDIGVQPNEVSAFLKVQQILQSDKEDQA